MSDSLFKEPSIVEEINSIKDLFTTVEKISAGGEGAVFKVISKTNNQVYALKKLFNNDRIPSVIQQMSILNKLNSPYINKIFKLYHDKKSNTFYQVMEYSNLDLNSLIDNGLSKRPTITRNIMFQILEAEKCLAENNIIHRDIKPLNYLISRDNKIKLTDFGLAADVSTASNISYAYTLLYRPPEVILGDDVTMASDIWAIGCVFYEIITNKILFKPPVANEKSYFNNMLRILGTPSNNEYPNWRDLPNAKLITSQSAYPSTLRSILDKTIPAEYEQIKPIIAKMLSFNPRNRPSIDDLLKDPFFSIGKEESDMINLSFLAETHASKSTRNTSKNVCYPSLARPPLPLISV